MPRPLALLLLLVADHAPPAAGPLTGTTPVPGDAPNWLERHADFVAAVARGPAVVALGDSLAWGWDDHPDLWATVTPAPTLFAAIGGDATNQLLWRLDHGALTGPPPRLVVVQVGTNNRWVNDDPADIVAGIVAVVGRVRRRQPASRVLVVGILPQGRHPDGSSRRVFAAVNRRLPQLADGRVAVCDVGDCLLEADGTLSEAVSPDGTHLSRQGYERLAAALGPAVRAGLAD
jgi:beta-glucosidase